MNTIKIHMTNGKEITLKGEAAKLLSSKSKFLQLEANPGKLIYINTENILFIEEQKNGPKPGAWIKYD